MVTTTLKETPMSFEYLTPAITKWKLDTFMQIINQFEDDLAEITHHKMSVGDDYQTILVHIAGKSILTTREVLTLCAHGYPDGALSLGRNLYEQMIIIAFLEIHKNDMNFKEYVDDFFLSYEVQLNKCLRSIEKYIPDDEKENLLKEYDELKNRTNCNLKSDYWWAQCCNFAELVSCVMENQTDKKMLQFLGIQYARYKRACVSLHASCMGNSNRLGNHTSFDEVDTSPTIYGQSVSLIFASISLISIIGFICHEFQIDSDKYLDSLNELAIFYQNEEKELKLQHH